MRAVDLAIPFPLVPRSSAVTEAVRLLAQNRSLAVVITDETGTVDAIVSAVEIARLMLPDYLLDDLSLAGVLDDDAIADLFEETDRRTLGEAIDAGELNVRSVETVDADATLVEITARMVDSNTHVVHVCDLDDRPRFITLPIVLEAMLSLRPATGNGLST